MAAAIPEQPTKGRRQSKPDLAAVPLRLEPGDHLTRPEFEQRYAAMPNLKKAESKAHQS